MTDLYTLTAVEAAKKIAEGEVSSKELVEACINRIEEREETICAWIHFDPDYARKQAEAADAARSRGAGIGPLHGVPVAIKDILDTSDMPTENGTPIHEGRQPTEDSAVVAQLREAGAVIMGKTVTTEVAFFHPGKTRNPYNPDHTPGGSSSGSAAAVADLMVPIAIGTQTAGSVIRPASFCGVYGYKPTYGLVSRRGVLSQSPPLDTIGPFARSVEDLAFVTDCMSAYDGQDRASWPRSRTHLYDLTIKEPPVSPTFAFVKSPYWEHADAVTHEAFKETAMFLGNACDEVELPEVFDNAKKWQQIIQIADVAKSFGPLLDEAPDKISKRLRDAIDEGRAISAIDYNRARDYQEVLNAGLDQIFERYDAILTPAAPGAAPKGIDATGDPIFNILWTFTGVPVVSLPLLQTEEGMPMGVQLAGPRRDDGRLLRTARWLANAVHEAEIDGQEAVA